MNTFSPANNLNYPMHPHSSIRDTWQSLIKSGDVGKGQYTLKAKHPSGSECEYSLPGDVIPWFLQNSYEICKTEKHPTNRAAAEKLNYQKSSVDSAISANVTDAMWGGLARDIMMWLDFDTRPTAGSLLKHLENVGTHIPQWLRDEPEMQHLDHVPSKGTRCAIIYKAMEESRIKEQNELL